MNYVIFDDRYIENFYPLTLNRSTGDLRLGILKLRQRIAAFMEIENPALVIPGHLSETYQERHPDKKINALSNGETVFINSRLKISDDWVKRLQSLSPNSLLAERDAIIAFRCETKERELSSEELEKFSQNLNRIDIDPEPVNCWQYTWELISNNSEYIRNDFFEFFYEQDNFFETEPGVTILNPYNVWIGEGSQFKPGVVIDASEGPVVIDENVRILPNAVISGPVYIGKNTLIKAAAKIYEGTTIGPTCKIGGEVESSIIQGFSNKQHDGFLGHAFLGEWINLGADTNNSDLKNNYKPVKSYFYPAKETINTGNQFLGAIIGDHSKTGINCSINTGTVIGIGCNLYGHELLSGFIPSFSWGTGNDLRSYRLDAFLQTAETVKQRRKVDLTSAEENLIAALYKMKM
jgi:UDP-N-acetylglucosamine diphosphorylase/glucosamine-1-phosphate N-acetyltransferase